MNELLQLLTEISKYVSNFFGTLHGGSGGLVDSTLKLTHPKFPIEKKTSVAL